MTASRYPFPTVCKEDQASDWFNSLQNSLHWNKRERQKSFAVVESHPNRHHKGSSSSSHKHLQPSHSPHTATFSPLSRSETPSLSGHHNGNQKSSSSPAASSDAGLDEVFGVFCDDDSGKYRYHGGGNSNTTGRRRSSAMEAESSASSFVTDESFDESEGESDDSDYTPDGFTGWTDEEIIESRFLANITNELERVFFKYTKT